MKHSKSSTGQVADRDRAIETREPLRNWSFFLLSVLCDWYNVRSETVLAGVEVTRILINEET